MVPNLNPQPPLPPRNGSLVPKPGAGNAIAPPTFGNADEDSLNLRLALSMLRRRWWILLLVGSAVSSIMGMRVLQEPPLYRSQFRLLVEPIASDQQFDQFSQRLIGQLGTDFDYETQIEVLRSPTVLQPILNEIQTQYPELDYSGLMSSLSVAQLGVTKIIEIGYQDSDPNKIKFVLEALAEGMIDYSQQEQQTGRQKGLEFVEGQLPVLEKRVNDLQAQLETFRQTNNIIDPNTQGQRVAERLSTITDEQRNTRTTLNETRSLTARLEDQIDLGLDQAMVVAALSEAPRYQNLLNQLQALETELALESARFTENNPTIVSLRARREQLLPLIRAEAETVLGSEAVSEDIKSLAASPNPIRLQLTQDFINATNEQQMLAVRSAALALAENQARQDVDRFATLNRQYTDLKRQLDVATESLNRFLSVQEDLQIEAAQRTISWEILNAPELPLYPIAPNVMRGMMLALMAGLLSGAGAMLVAEKLDVRFHSPDDIQDMVKLPLLGVVPYRKEFRDKKGIEKTLPMPAGNRRYQTTPFLEAFRSLNANLSFFTPDKPLQVIVVSSSVPLEGKSTTAIHLAQTAAAMGQKVLIVDADLRRPQVHAMTDLPNVWGLSHVISMDLEVDDVIQRSPNDDNLSILTSGQIPPDPTRLLSSQKMRGLVELFRDRYDLIIFDTPPMLGLADAKFLAAHSDVMLLVVRLGWTDRTFLKQVLESLKVSHASNLGIVANGAKDFTSGSYYYYNRYFSNEDGLLPLDQKQ
ncbi:polysaccharide biosynthesis tyrosine autokinase [Spirulina major CS-329]|uniref:GumC family protein n=1 Tax=Spirulina TaxID=1154 RepID=UPI00232CB431|nr:MULTISPECIES: polysaccharide biosynthesis tyrosine autokinase [Spirulina]MDB9494865.1 polysaccharide biosynthesis tyrosine autokinase [Spirulina subsalsa CS-330]MDB9504304.1 polysaccharide biosynthesis tyrosine autokinase [Spirulina major CS-329]